MANNLQNINGSPFIVVYIVIVVCIVNDYVAI